MQVPVHYTPRAYQQEALEALDKGVRTAVWCWARRGGKDMTAFAYAVRKMVEEPMNVVLVFPTKAQGKDAFWDNVENDGFKTIEHIPKELIARYDNNDLKITLINGSTFQLLGATDPDSLRGANAKLYIFSEFVDIPKSALEVIRPVVRNNGGQIIIQSTPKIDGISGGTFKLLFDRANRHEKQFASLVTAREYLSEEELEEIRMETIEENGNDFFYKQEYLCDWGQASQTTYYGEVLRKMEQDGLIGMHPYDNRYPVYTSWDLGMSDSTAITFFQYYLKDGKPQTHIIDYYETSNIGAEPIVKYVQSKPYNIAWNFLPHDGSVRDMDAIQRIERIREHGLVNSSLLRRVPREDGIERTVKGLSETLMHHPTTVGLIRKLYLYKRKFNALTGDYIGPDHKTESHAADSVRYMFDAIEQEFDKEKCEMYLSHSSQGEVYESDSISTHLYSPSY